MNSRLRTALSQFKHNWEVRKDRRHMLALAAAGAFLLFSFWNSFQNNRLKSDIAKAHVKETIQSGRIHVPDRHADFAAVILVEVDEQGQLKNVFEDLDTAPDANSIFDKLTLTPMKVNNVARAAKIPLTIPFDTGDQE